MNALHLYGAEALGVGPEDGEFDLDERCERCGRKAWAVCLGCQYAMCPRHLDDLGLCSRCAASPQGRWTHANVVPVAALAELLAARDAADLAAERPRCAWCVAEIAPSDRHPCAAPACSDCDGTLADHDPDCAQVAACDRCGSWSCGGECLAWPREVAW